MSTYSARELERELAAVRGQLEESAKTGLKYMAQAADETRLRERAESALAAAKAEAEELRKELADRPSVGMVQLLKQTIKAEHDEAEALREALERYGLHEESCPIVDKSGDRFCTCGFDAALGDGK